MGCTGGLAHYNQVGDKTVRDGQQIRVRPHAVQQSSIETPATRAAVVAAGRSVMLQPETRLGGCDVGIVQANWRTCWIQTLLSPLEIQISDDPFGKSSNFKKVIRYVYNYSLSAPYKPLFI